MVNWHVEVIKRKEQLLHDLDGLLRIPSVKQVETSEPGAPMGKEIGRALHYMLDLSAQDGFRTANLEGYVGYAELGLPLKHKIRFIFGTDEESGSRCMARYRETEKLPIAGFTPDADFPIVHAEKGQINTRVLLTKAEVPARGSRGAACLVPALLFWGRHCQHGPGISACRHRWRGCWLGSTGWKI